MNTRIEHLAAHPEAIPRLAPGSAVVGRQPGERVFPHRRPPSHEARARQRREKEAAHRPPFLTDTGADMRTMGTPEAPSPPP